MPSDKLHLRLLKDRNTDGRTYNLPTASEIAVLIVGDIDSLESSRDIVVEMHSKMFKRINELHPLYLPFQYPLLFPYGEEGFREKIALSDSSLSSSRKRQNLSMREFFCFRLQERLNEAHTILLSRNLLHQFIVDAFTMIESQRLTWFRFNQDKLRTDIYKGLADAVLRGDIDPASQGKRIILPSSFTGGFRYKFQNFQDAMTICQKKGYPNLFITFTCNPRWPEIIKFTSERSLHPCDRPDILCRVFKIKLDRLIDDLLKDKYFGRVLACKCYICDFYFFYCCSVICICFFYIMCTLVFVFCEIIRSNYVFFYLQ